MPDRRRHGERVPSEGARRVGQLADAQGLTDAELETWLFTQPRYRAALPRAPIDFDSVHQELRRTGVTQQLLWTEYVEAATGAAGQKPPYHYTQVCERYHPWRGRLDLVMRQTHRADGEALVSLLRSYRKATVGQSVVRRQNEPKGANVITLRERRPGRR